MSLEVDINVVRNDFTLQAKFAGTRGVTALYGRSGVGKSTIINAVAGLITPKAGHIRVGEQTLFDAKAGINVPTHKRRIGYVFQDARLFPHLNAEQNLCYGGQHDKDRVIDLLGLGGLLHRTPRTLSGGEAQRVALGRALMCDPQILLMDEPLAALDDKRKAEIMPYLEFLRDEMAVPILYVSHAMSEVARLATTLVVLGQGKVLRAGPVEKILADPSAVPDVGVQAAGAVITARVSGFDAALGLTRLRFDGGELRLPGKSGQIGRALRLRVNAGDIILATEKPNGISALNVLPVTVTTIADGQGPGVAVGLACGRSRLLARITKASAAAMALAPGQDLYAIIKANAIAPGDVGGTGALDKASKES